MIKIKIGIYAPYLNTFGGGENYICKMADFLSKKNEVEFISFNILNIQEIKRRFNVDLKNVKLKKIESFKYFKLFDSYVKNKIISEESKNYDIFINQENHSMIPSQAKKSIYLCQVPPINSKNLNLFRNTKKKIKAFLLDGNLETYDLVLVYSNFVKKYFLRQYPKKEIKVLYPSIDISLFFSGDKKNIILSVGRFFSKGHSKKQLEMIRSYKKLYDEYKNMKNWEYHLVGGINDVEYYEKCRNEAKGYPIFFHTNIDFKELRILYSKAKIFWHATGFNENENIFPEKMEHFGMTTVEAMASGCVPIVINKGGQPEIVRSNVEGFLWNSEEELIKYTLYLMKNTSLMHKMSKLSIKRSEYFSLNKFNERIEKILLI